MKNGIPFDVAFSADDDWALAAYIVFGEYEGSDWDWQSMNWMKKD